jgi:hypothetical protein
MSMGLAADRVLGSRCACFGPNPLVLRESDPKADVTDFNYDHNNGDYNAMYHNSCDPSLA